MNQEGVFLIGADTEVGKTTALLNALVDWFKRDPTTRAKVILTFPTNDMCSENQNKLRGLARNQLGALASAFNERVVFEAGRRKIPDEISPDRVPFGCQAMRQDTA